MGGRERYGGERERETVDHILSSIAYSMLDIYKTLSAEVVRERKAEKPRKGDGGGGRWDRKGQR